MSLKKIVVADYSPEWPLFFDSLKRIYQSVLDGLVLDIQHVGSTSVPGLAAKPTIDIDLIINDRSVLPAVIEKLEGLGYQHQGDLGITDRESFRRPSDEIPIDGSGRVWQKHNLYCCTKDSVSLRNHLQFRDYLREHPEKAFEYGELKKELAAQDPSDIDRYVMLKTPFITGILELTGFESGELDSITEQNKIKLRPL